MYFRQFYLGCLAHASYLIGSDGVAAVVDPQRDVDQYIDAASGAGLRIRYVIETHLHADFVSGHRELAARTGARIVFGARAGATFPHRAVGEGDEIEVGRLVLRVLETPGHTPEGISVLATDTADPEAPRRLFTGDTLFIGDVGRPDLAGSKGFSAEEMAGMLYDSLHEKILALPDDVEVYPAHGAGSLCGRRMSSATMSTIGEQRKFNYALQPMGREAFIRMTTTDLPEAPAYFASDAEINRTGAAALEELTEARALPPGEVARLQVEGYLVLDVRPATAFGTGHVPGSLNIGLGGQFASWAGSLIPMGTKIVIVAEDSGGVDEAATRLARVGLDSVEGYLEGGIYAWDRAGFDLARVPQMPVDELRVRIGEGATPEILDVRRPAEYRDGHVHGSRNLPLSELGKAAAALDRSHPTVVICGSGYRSSAATSLLARMGFEDLCNIVGGMTAWASASYPVEARM
jgi:glyoxylase-like metal-dependent hydrolase (beta-lactamase superfamily II)/rhodanese-related sulfurtransferase